ncbi:Pr6Pr family membrane protein [Enterococcus sp. ALS3]|uniref:Pr6Pr family membrane protein n=1 Tax=Enterococcus alishanensis TaxID=1303817 RepID=A0ABS6T8M5_9ENTE|nr:Pr6Pr family membrane protein [Enterococcus alishanensis]MBV7389236.1 Pr6Pr family membrane protein [Enterococcus alishanensis]
MREITKNIFRFFLLIICGVGLSWQLGMLSGDFDSFQLIFYTIQSDFLIFLTYLFLVLTSFFQSLYQRKFISKDVSANLLGKLTLLAVLSSVADNFFTTPSTVDPRVIFLLHHFLPLLMLLDWFIFVPKAEIKQTKPLTWIIFPLLYWLFIVVRATFYLPLRNSFSCYPYSYLDADLLGWPTVFVHMFALLLLLLIIGYALKKIGSGRYLQVLKCWLKNNKKIM